LPRTNGACSRAASNQTVLKLSEPELRGENQMRRTTLNLCKVL
jgi:hypothetical protein